MMQKLKEEITAAANRELNRANEQFPLFTSKHEGVAVAYEELEESKEALEELETSFKCLWDDVRGKETPCYLKEEITPLKIADYAINLKVRVIDNITYNGVRFATYYDEYDVIQVNGDRVVIGIGNTVTAAVNAANIAKDEEIAEAPADAEVPTDIPTQEETENAHGFKVGQKVKVINAYDYYGNMFKCWYSKYDVIEVKNDRIVIGIGNTVTAAVNAANLAAA